MAYGEEATKSCQISRQSAAGRAALLVGHGRPGRPPDGLLPPAGQCLALKGVRGTRSGRQGVAARGEVARLMISTGARRTGKQRRPGSR